MNNLNILLNVILVITGIISGCGAGENRPKGAEDISYWEPAWYDNEHIIYTKHVDTVKFRYDWLADIGNMRSERVRTDYYICVTDLEGKEEKIEKAVKHMIEGLKTVKHEHKDDGEREHKENQKDINEKTKKDSSYRPEVLKKFVVASIEDVGSFGHSLWYKSQQHNLHTAKRKAYIGDGDRKLWSIYEENFRAEEWTPILDFIHAVEYVFESSKLSTDTENQCWAKYIESVNHIWQGRPLTVIRKLDKTLSKLENSKKNKSKELQDKIDKLKSVQNLFPKQLYQNEIS